MSSVHQPIYIIVAGDFVQTGGMDAANFALARYFADAGASVHLVAHRVSRDLSSHRAVQWHRVARPLGSDILGGPLLERAARRVARQLSILRPCVIVNGGNACMPAVVNWVHFVHAASDVPTGYLRRIIREFHARRERKALDQATLVVADSRRTANDLVRFCGVQAVKLRVVYYGIDRRRFSPVAEAIDEVSAPPDARLRQMRAIFVGALGDRRKGLDTVLRSWKRLCSSAEWDVQLYVVGAGKKLSRYRGDAQRAGLGSSIQFLGFQADVAGLLKAADVMVAPSRYEPFGLAVLEALCTGVPAIVSREAGVAELYPPNLSELLLDDPEDANELVDRLLAWRRSFRMYREKTAELAVTLRTRTWETMAEEISALAMRLHVP